LREYRLTFPKSCSIVQAVILVLLAGDILKKTGFQVGCPQNKMRNSDARMKLNNAAAAPIAAAAIASCKNDNT
jgi:hypothetical protein